MKRDILTSILLLSILSMTFLMLNCGEDEPEKQNQPPSVSITSPADNAAIQKGETTSVSVNASDSDGSISNVKISIDNTEVASLNSGPYTYSWNTSNEDAGQHTIKAVATDNGGLTATDQISVNLTADAPTVTTADITDITGETAVGGGNVTDDGGDAVTARGVVWSETTGPTVDSNDGKTEDGSGTGEFTSNISGLDPETEYFVKAYATNSAGTAYGEEKSFTTLALPTVVTGVVSDITSNSAVGAGDVTDNGGDAITARGLVWSATNEQVTLDDADGSTTEGTGTGTFSSTMTSLTRNTEYWVRAYATNSAGTAYGDAVLFNTLPEPPTISTNDITDIEAHLARGGGVLTDDGGDPYTSFGLVWSSSPNPDYYTNEGFYITPDYVSPFDTLISGLESETMYYVRAWAVNWEGTYVYGEEKTFTTGTFSYTTGTFTDSRDNKEYNTITISGQTWMAENLIYLPEVCAADADCGYWVYDYQGTDVAAAMATSNYTTYGVLYSFETAQTVCPTGWHLPSDYEWSYLEVHLGMSIAETIAVDWRGTNQGGKMKETGTAHWNAPNYGATNISGFTALPGGLRDSISKSFGLIGTGGYFWSSTEEGNFANYRQLYNLEERISTNWVSTIIYSSTPGGSVRCVQD